MISARSVIAAAIGLGAICAAQTVVMDGLPIHMLQPIDGGEDRILVAAGPVVASSIQELAQ